jgi:hypothetical protein
VAVLAAMVAALGAVVGEAGAAVAQQPLAVQLRGSASVTWPSDKCLTAQ